MELTDSSVGMAESEGLLTGSVGFLHSLQKAPMWRTVRQACEAVERSNEGGRPPPRVRETYRNMTRYDSTTILTSVLVAAFSSSSRLTPVEYDMRTPWRCSEPKNDSSLRSHASAGATRSSL